MKVFNRTQCEVDKHAWLSAQSMVDISSFFFLRSAHEQLLLAVFAVLSYIELQHLLTW